jgi:hypothetical protein
MHMTKTGQAVLFCAALIAIAVMAKATPSGTPCENETAGAAAKVLNCLK